MRYEDYLKLKQVAARIFEATSEKARKAAANELKAEIAKVDRLVSQRKKAA